MYWSNIRLAYHSHTVLWFHPHRKVNCARQSPATSSQHSTAPNAPVFTKLSHRFPTYTSLHRVPVQVSWVWKTKCTHLFKLSFFTDWQSTSALIYNFTLYIHTCMKIYKEPKSWNESVYSTLELACCLQRWTFDCTTTTTTTTQSIDQSHPECRQIISFICTLYWLIVAIIFIICGYSCSSRRKGRT